MKKNSFKELEELELKETSMKSDSIKNGIVSDIGMMKYVSSVIDLYFPKIVDLFVSLAGGSPSIPDNSKRTPKKYPDM